MPSEPVKCTQIRQIRLSGTVELLQSSMGKRTQSRGDHPANAAGSQCAQRTTLLRMLWATGRQLGARDRVKTRAVSLCAVAWPAAARDRNVFVGAGWGRPKMRALRVERQTRDTTSPRILYATNARDK